MAERFDAIVVGTGQAAPALCARLDKEGLRTLLIERKLLGGTCVNTGCIPTKTMIASARAAHLAGRGDDYGFASARVRVDMKAVKRRKDQVVRLNDSAFDHVNQVPAEHVRCKQHLAGPALESFGADGVRVQPDTTRLERVDQVLADEHVLRSDPDLQPRHGRVGAVGELDDEVFDPPDLRSGWVEDRAAQELRDHQPPLVMQARRLLHIAVHTSIAHCFMPSPL